MLNMRMARRMGCLPGVEWCPPGGMTSRADNGGIGMDKISSDRVSADKTSAEKVSGYVEHIIYRNTENGYTVFELIADGEEITKLYDRERGMTVLNITHYMNEAAEADRTNFYLFHVNCSFIYLISYMFIAQAYSAGLSIIFTFSGFPVLRESITASAATQAA